MIQRIEALGLFGLGLWTKNPGDVEAGRMLMVWARSFGLWFRKLLPETRKSNPISKLLRPVFETPKIKSLVGIQLTVITLLTGMFSSLPASALGMVSSETAGLERKMEIQIKTDSSLTYPVPEAIGVSQTYHVLHAGIDIRAPKGSAVLPLASGKVVAVLNHRSGYGRHLIIDHGGEVQSLYAHLGKIYVQEGDEVALDKVIGEVGMTGWTTGPHLHLEVIEAGRRVNPALYLWQIE